MTPMMLRQLWALVDDTHSNILIHMDDSSLVQWLLRQFGSIRSLDGSEADLLRDYIHSRLPLIREMAHSR